MHIGRGWEEEGEEGSLLCGWGWLGVTHLTQLASLHPERERVRERERETKREGETARGNGRGGSSLRSLASWRLCSCVRVFGWVIGYPGIRGYILIA